MKKYKQELYKKLTENLFSIANQRAIDKLDVIIPYFEEIQNKANLRKSEIKKRNLNSNPLEDSKTLQKFSSDIKSLISIKEGILFENNKELADNAPAIVNEQLSQYNDQVKQEQLPERFSIKGDESYLLKIEKYIKIIIFKISKTPFFIKNKIRTIRKKPVEKITYWKHNIELKAITHRNILNPFINTFMICENFISDCIKNKIEELQYMVTETTIRPYVIIEQELDFKVWRIELEDYVKQQFDNTIAEYYTSFEDDLEKSGTIELQNKPLKRKTNKDVSKLIKHLDIAEKENKNKISTTINNWTFQMGLLSYSTEISIKNTQYKSTFTQKFNQAILPAQKQIEAFLQNIREELAEYRDSNDSELRSFIVVNLYKMKKNFLPQINSITNLQFVQQLLNSTANLENSLAHIVESMHKEDTENDKNQQPIILFGDFWNVIPDNYISKYVYPIFQSKMSDLKHTLAQLMEQTGELGQDLHHILDFCFDAALDMIDAPETTRNKNGETPWDVLNEGFDNALKKCNIIEAAGTNVLETFTQNIMDHILFLTNKIEGLYFDENITEIKAHMTKEKMMDRTQIIENYIKKFISHAQTKTIFSYKKTTNKLGVEIQKLKRILHLNKTPNSITSELSNFLVESNEQIRKLPLVYRRLFELKPLDEPNLFMGRNTEINVLKKAYDNWTNGNYAASIIYGENGSGKSSLKNYFISTLKSNHRIISFKTDDFLYTDEHFYQTISKMFETEIRNHNELEDYVNNTRQKAIIVIDGFERFFVRKLHGNICLHNTLDFIMRTSKMFFWVLTSSESAYNYLCRIYNLNDYFDYNIKMETVNEEEILNIIFKRNRLSGYNLVFEPSIEDKSNKFNNLSVEKQQKYLEIKYFTKLNQFAKSNLSLSISYWLISILRIKENTLYVQSFKAPDFTFLTNLSAEKTYALFLIILHGKLGTNEFSEALHINLKSSARVLLTLKEDGLLLETEGYYILHPILYRHVRELLRKKNLIH